MLSPNELDMKNVYNPDLDNIKEAAERTYGEANAFFEIIESYLKNEKEINTFTTKQIYDKTNAIATQLAMCCELYLKALYIFENNIEENKIEELWKKLKTSEYKLDANGNYIYLLEQNNEKIYTYVKLDENGKRERDQHGENIYTDKNNNIYSEGKQGKKIRQSGHELDRLINMLSTDSQKLLEIRMLSIPSANTDMYDKVTIYDELKKINLISTNQKISYEKYISWLEQHKKTFEQARYSGQAKHAINLEFLYHLTKQIKAVADYKISPSKNQEFDLKLNNHEMANVNATFIANTIKNQEKNLWKTLPPNNDNEIKSFISNEEISPLPDKIQNIFQFINLRIMSKEFLNLIKNDKEIQTKLMYMINCYGIYFFEEINSSALSRLLISFNQEEIGYVVKICKLVSQEHIPPFDHQSQEQKNIENIVTALELLNYSVNDIIDYMAYLKKKYHCQINSDLFINFIDYAQILNNYYDMIDNDIKESIEETKHL